MVVFIWKVFQFLRCLYIWGWITNIYRQILFTLFVVLLFIVHFIGFMIFFQNFKTRWRYFLVFRFLQFFMKDFLSKFFTFYIDYHLFENTKFLKFAWKINIKSFLNLPWLLLGESFLFLRYIFDQNTKHYHLR